MLREGREHGVGAASQRRGISTLSLSTHSVLSLSMHSVLSLSMHSVLSLSMRSVLSLSMRSVLSLSTHLGLSLSRYFLGWWSHCRQKRGTLLTCNPREAK